MWKTWGKGIKKFYHTMAENYISVTKYKSKKN